MLSYRIRRAMVATLLMPMVYMGTLTAASPMETLFSTKTLSRLSSDQTIAEGGTLAIKPESNRFDVQRKELFQTFGDETITVTLPNIPVYTRVDDSWAATIAVQNKVEFWVAAPLPAVSGIEQELLFPLIIEIFSNKPYRMNTYEVSEIDGFPLLKLSSYNKNTGKTEMTHVVITEKNFYVIQIKYPKKLEGKVNAAAFLESFRVI